MNDVTGKRVSLRRATAQGRLNCDPATLQTIRDGRLPKGEPFGIAEAAGLLAAKQTAALIPHCHPVQIDQLKLSFEIVETGVAIQAVAASIDRTGIEMEAMTAVSVAALVLYDLCKPLKGDLEIASVRLSEKTGGRTQEKKDFSGEGLNCAILTISTSRAAKPDAADPSGDLIAEVLTAAGVTVSRRALVGDDIEQIRSRVRSWQDEPDLNFIFTTGGTGPDPRDVTVAALQPLLQKELPGIGEAMRGFGQDRVQSAMFSASLAGVVGKSLLVALPGSPAGVRESLQAILPALLHGPHVMGGGGHEKT